jgi:hypothetical protein
MMPVRSSYLATSLPRGRDLTSSSSVSERGLARGAVHSTAASLRRTSLWQVSTAEGSQLTEWFTYLGRVEATIIIEKALGVSISDPELEAVKTGMDLVSHVRARLSPTDPAASRLPEVVRAAIAATRDSETSLEQLPLPLEALLGDVPSDS